jgi:hypothetical protein
MFLIFQTILKEMVDRISTINGNIIIVKILVKIKKDEKDYVVHLYCCSYSILFSFNFSR